ncbi:MAG: hypothetical protein IT445_12075 [Phycisphaeraceae bacterium]|nr:hypothetical protein [Phycisphaeraceae bacterium]
MSDIKWPVLQFGSQLAALKYTSAEKFVKMRYTGIQYINSMAEFFVIDTLGMRYDFSDVRLATPVGLLRAIYYRVFSPIIEVQFDTITFYGQVSLDELKTMMKSNFEEIDDVWIEYGDIEELKARVDACASYRGVIELF